MSWALQFDGVDDGLKFEGLLTSTLTVKMKISSDMERSSGWQALYDGRLNGGSGYLFIAPNNIGQAVGVSGIKINGSSASATDVFYASAGDIIEFTTSGHGGGFTLFVANTLGNSLKGQLEWVEVYFSSILTNSYSATASDRSNTGAQPVLVDTIGGNNATGVNFPTDGSAWVDLGGGTPPVTTHTADFSKTTLPILVDNFSGQQSVTAAFAKSSLAISLDNLTGEQLVTAGFSKNTVAITVDSVSFASGPITHTASFEKNSIAIAADNFTGYQSVTANGVKSSVGATIDNFTGYQSIYADFTKTTVIPVSDNFTGYQSVTATFNKSTLAITVDSIYVFNAELANLDFKNMTLSIVEDSYSFATIEDTYSFELIEENYEVN